MKFSVALVFIASYAFGQDQAPAPDVESACGPQGVKLEVKVDRLRHPAPAPPDGKALVYVVNQEIHDNIGVDGKWVGANDRGTYFFVAVVPGTHHLCAYATYFGSSWLSLHSLQAKAGESYYFRPIAIGNGGRGGTYALEQLDPDEGRYLVSKAKFGTSQPR